MVMPSPGLAASAETRFGRKPKRTAHQQAEVLKRLAGGESCRSIAKTMAVHCATVARSGVDVFRPLADGQRRTPQSKTKSYHEYANGRFLARAFMKYGWDHTRQTPRRATIPMSHCSAPV